MPISIQEAQNLYTQTFLTYYREDTPVTSFFRSFFPTDLARSKNVSIGVERDEDVIAVDVSRHSDGVLNQSTKNTQKIFQPPMYHEYIVASDHELYDTVLTQLASGTPDAGALRLLAEANARDMVKLRKKIERSKELQCAQVFDTGILELESQTNIDFKRKALSKVDLTAGGYWTVATVDPRTSIQTGINYIRQTGKAVAGVFNVIMGSGAFSALQSNAIIKAEADIINYDRITLNMPQMNAVGGTLQGEMAVGNYRVRLWTYDGFYKNAAGNHVEYWASNKVVVLPETTNFRMSYALVPQLISAGGTIPQTGEYLMQEFFNEQRAQHTQHLKTAPVAIPVAVDTIYTMQVTA